MSKRVQQQPAPLAHSASSGVSKVEVDLRNAIALHRRGRLEEAEKLYRNCLKIVSDHFDAQHLLGLLKYQQGRGAEALGLIATALQKNPNEAVVLSNYGAILSELNRFDEALVSFDKAIALKPSHLEALYNRGTVLHGLKRFDEALASYDKAIALMPNYTQALNNRGNALMELNRFDEALASYDKAIAVKPNFAEAANNRGNALKELNRFHEALASYDKAIALKPNYAEAHNNRGNALQELNRFKEAQASYDKAIALRPNYAEAFNNRGNALNELKCFGEALASLAQAITLKPNYAEAFNNRGNVLKELNRFDEALTNYDTAIALKPDSAEAFNNRGNVLKELNRFDEALASFAEAIALKPRNAEALNNRAIALMELGLLAEAQRAAEQAVRFAPRKPGYYQTLGNISPYRAGDCRVAALEELAQAAESLSIDDRIELHFALAKAYEDLGKRDMAFDQLLAGNALKRQQINYNEAKTLAAMNRTQAAFSSEFIRPRLKAGNPSSVPAFIIGMPRSGSTLVEQILAAHPRVFGGGELKHFAGAVEDIRAKLGGSATSTVLAPAMTDEDFHELGTRYLAKVEKIAPGAARITDKMTGNFNLAGLIHLALPNAPIIHTMRDPVDTCISCFSKLFADATLSFTYDLAELGRYYRHYRALMAHWHRVLPPGRILDVRYEEVVVDLEGQARRIVDYCGLEWDPQCLAFHQTVRPVRTFSATQVRQPIYDNAVGRWRPYEKFLIPLLTELTATTTSTKT